VKALDAVITKLRSQNYAWMVSIVEDMKADYLKGQNDGNKS
jgi:hypothetical protein